MLPFEDPPTRPPFAHRLEAGRELAGGLPGLRGASPIVLGLLAGGIPVAREVARVLGVPLGVCCVFKIPVPGQPEVAAGAIAHGARYIVEDVVRELEISSTYLDASASVLEADLARRRAQFGEWTARDLSGRTVVLVDDGISSGASAAAAILSMRRAGAGRVVVAAPVATRAGLQRVCLADEVVVPFLLRADRRVGQAYEDFQQLSDQDALVQLRAAQRERQQSAV